MDLKAKLERFDRDKFDAESRADAELIESQIKLAELGRQGDSKLEAQPDAICSRR